MPVSQSEFAKAIYFAGVGGADTVAEARLKLLQAMSDLKLVGKNVPNCGPQGPYVAGELRYRARNVSEYIQRVHHPTGKGQVAVVYIGETHVGASSDAKVAARGARDHKRAEDVLANLSGAAGYQTVVVFERGMNYRLASGSELNVVREENLTTYSGIPFGQGLRANIRTAVVAAYLAAYLAHGDQEQNVLFVIFFGDNHADLSRQMEYFVTAGSRYCIDWLEKRPRSYAHAPGA